jgi:hypothetical protein
MVRFELAADSFDSVVYRSLDDGHVEKTNRSRAGWGRCRDCVSGNCVPIEDSIGASKVRPA